jgi:ATP-binding cassette subfamily F protein 3
MLFSGGVLVVSHDEHLITAVCDELWIIRDQRVHLSEGDFDEYKESVVKLFRAGAKHEAAQ